jgi:hypothetical protein
MEKAARLLGAVEHFCAGLVNTLPPPDRDQYHAGYKTARDNLGDTQFNQCYEQGGELTFIQVVKLALEEIR